MTIPASRPRRSCLYMPGANARALEKARNLDADVLILDLEDAVAPEEKDTARAQVAAAVAAGGYDRHEVVVRVNALDTEWGRADLAAVLPAGPDAILAPKIASAGDVQAFDAAMATATADMQLWAMIETPAAIFHLREIALAAANTRLSTLVVGTNDLAKDMRATFTPDRAAFQSALSMTVMAARMAGLGAIDGVYNDIGDTDELAAECAQGRVFGFDGKTLIHPAQIETCNAAFSPDAEEIAWANAVIAAFARPENAGKGVVLVDGRMTERLHLAQAEALMARAT
ncbi:MAG: CoA ester lyase [Pacificimonas sp.]